MTPEERMMMMILQQTNNPFGQQRVPTTLGQAVNAELAQVRPEAMVAAGMTPGMGAAATSDAAAAREDAMRRAAQSVGGQAARLKSQQAFADQLRASKTPGVKTVGPSNIAVMNPWEGLETGINRAVGGYLSGQLKDDYAALDEAKSEADLAKMQYQDILTGEERGFTAEQAALKQAVDRELAQMRDTTSRRGQDLQSASSAASTAATIRGQDITAGTAEASGWGDKQYLDMETGQPTIIARNERTGEISLGGRGGTPISQDDFATRFMEYTAPSEGGSGATMDKFWAQKEIDDRQKLWETEAGSQTALDGIDSQLKSFTNILTNPDVDKYTGLINPDRILAKYGISPDAWRGQSIDQQLKYATTAGIADLASIFKPMSDTDLKYLLSQFAASTDQPETITVWMGNQGRAAIEKSYRQARADATGNPEIQARLDAAWEQTQEKLDASIAQAAFRQGIPVEDAAKLGIEPEDLALYYSVYGGQ